MKLPPFVISTMLKVPGTLVPGENELGAAIFGFKRIAEDFFVMPGTPARTLKMLLNKFKLGVVAIR